MEALIAILIEQATIWAPSLIACVGVLIGILKGIGNLRDTVNDIKDENSFKEIRDELKKQHGDLLREHNDNIILKKQLQEIVNQLSHVQDYKIEQFGQMEGEKADEKEPNE